MSKVSIVTDSVASIPESMINELNISIVPYFIHWGEETFQDLVNIQREPFYSRLALSKTLPKTANPSPGNYAQVYQQLAQENRSSEIVSIHMTSKGSGAFQAALAGKRIALEAMPDLKIGIIDTLNVSLCQGWMVIEAARDALSGVSYSGIIERVKSMMPFTKMLQTADTLKYLYMGGRIGGAKHLLGTALKIMPIIGMQNGLIVPLGQARTRARVYQMMIEKVETAVGRQGKIKIAFVHAAAKNEAQKLKALVENRFDIVESIIAELSPALGVHTGPGTVGMCYFPVNS
ncbi:MAG: DegV family protein [Chloroflexi bacterium]|nr:DegV family protein [Chloroflexota bacterium]